MILQAITRALAVALCCRLAVATASDVDFRFVDSYLSDEFFWTPVYNVVDCRERSGARWSRSVSSTGHGLASVHGASEALATWVDAGDRQTFIVNVNCPASGSVLEQANALRLFRKPFAWLLVDATAFDAVNATRDLSSTWYWQTLQDMDVLLDAEVRMMEASPTSIRIVGGYKIAKEGELLREELGEWSPEGGLALNTRACAAIRRWNLRGAPLPTSFVATNPDTLNHLEDIVDKHVDSISKVGYVLFKQLAEMINSSLAMRVVDTWGNLVNGTWNGMMADLESGAAELGISEAFVREDRMKILHYYERIVSTKSKFIFLSPPLSFSSNIFAMPFDRTVWLCSFVTVAVSCVLLYFATRMEASESAQEGEGEEEAEGGRRNRGLGDSFADIIMLNIGAICLQGTAAEPKGPASRTIILFLYFSYMFLYVSYSGSIVALLQSSDTSIRTFKDLLESPLRVGAHDVVYSQYYFKTESDPVRKALYDKKVAPKSEAPHFLPAEEGIASVKKGLYAFHVEASVGYHLIQKTFTEDEKCGLQVFEVSFIQNIDPLLVMRPHTPFAETVKIGIKVQKERGLNHRAEARLYTKKPICGSKGSRFVSVGLTDCYYVFLILLYGFALSWIIFLGERVLGGRLNALKARLKRGNAINHEN